MRDSPGRVVERLGLHGLMAALRLGAELGLGADEVDELTGPLIGRARGTVRAFDAAGLAAGRLFARDGDTPLALDLASGEHRPRRRLASPAVVAAREEPDLARRLRLLAGADEPAGRFVRTLLEEEGATRRWWPTRSPTTPRRSTGRCGWASRASWARSRRWRCSPAGRRRRATRRPGSWTPSRCGAGPRASRATRDASIVELGDGLLGVELHAGLNLLGPAVQALLARAVELAGARYDALVIGASGPDFSAGADLGPAAAAAEAGDWDRIEVALRGIQGLVRAIRFSPAPVVAAPRGHALGGGAEICLAAARRQPLDGVALGLPEALIGLIPAAGGTAAMARAIAARAADPGADALAPFLARFRDLARGRVASSAAEAVAMGLLEPGDLGPPTPSASGPTRRGSRGRWRRPATGRRTTPRSRSSAGAGWRPAPRSPTTRWPPAA